VDGRKGDVLMVTEENNTTSCPTSGRFATYDLKGSYRGEGFRGTKGTKHRLRELDTWTPEDQDGSTGCDSAHYFTDRGDGVVAIAFYTQGTRLLDVRDPKNIKQIGFYRPDDANTWAAYWRPGGHLFVADFDRGVDVLKVGASAKPVKAPPLPTREAPNLPDEVLGWLCQVPRTVADDLHHGSA
jgi:hypothetical protein